ncbi:DUF4209 domain-containing protein [Amycolatopsis sp. NPDC006131]|uniref:DUF4209 domain-containing protein n=1 Tax=Amycolatopsis sp. NPDC006131 TaxID=3156731 RepID=UPI0033ACA821
MPDFQGNPVALNLSDDSIASLSKLADKAAAHSSAWHEVSSKLKAAEDSAEMDALKIAFDYVDTSRRPNSGSSTYEPMMRAEGQTYPTPLEELPEDVLVLWEKVVKRTQSNAIKARLSDLLYSTSRQPKHEFALVACKAYLLLSSDNWSDLHRAHALIRALDIARQMRIDSIINEIHAKFIYDARASIGKSEHQPGVALRLIGRLLEDKSPPAEIDEVLHSAVSRYSHDPHTAVEVHKMRRGRANNDDEVAAVDRDLINTWIEAAKETDEGFLKMSHLTKAIAYARDHQQSSGVTELLHSATVLLQQISREDLPMQKISQEYTFTDEQIEAWLAWFIRENLEASLAAYARGYGCVPPSGELAQNRAAVGQLAEEAPLSYAFSAVIIGGDGLPRWEPHTEEERENHNLTRHESLNIQFIAPLYDLTLTKIGEKFSPSREQVQQVMLEVQPEKPEIARTLADALFRYWNDDREGCMYVVAPKIEAIIRNLARSLNEPIYSLQRTRSPGKYVGLATLLQILKDKGLDESWYRYLHTLLSSTPGLNLRNEIAHGFIDMLSPPLVALLVQAALYVAFLRAGPTTTSEQEAAEAASQPEQEQDEPSTQT